MKTDKQKTGAWGEELVISFLLEKKYDIITRNYRIREGEIDIIAWRDLPLGKTLCFIEVKTRGRNDGSAERAVGRSKIIKMKKTAQIYCMRNRIDMMHTPIQFEQVSVYGKDNMRHYEIPM